MTPLETYLNELRKIRSSGEAVAETSYYGALETLLNEIGKNLKPKVRCVINIRNRGAGIPDGGLFTADQLKKSVMDVSSAGWGGQIPSRGVMEVKSTPEDVWAVAKTEQVRKYLRSFWQSRRERWTWGSAYRVA